MHLSGKRRDGHHARATTALAVGAAIVLLAGGSAALAASDAVRAPSCTAQQGQAFIDAGRYDQAIREFTCVIDAAPTEPEGYRGRMEAKVLLGRFSDAVGDCTRVYAFVVPVHADYQKTMLAGYGPRLAIAPSSVTALTGASFPPLVLLRLPGGDSRAQPASGRPAGRRLRQPLPWLEPRPQERDAGARSRGSRACDRARAGQSRCPLHRRRRVHVRLAGSRAGLRGSIGRARRRARHAAHPRDPRELVHRLRRPARRGDAHSGAHRHGHHTAPAGPRARTRRLV